MKLAEKIEFPFRSPISIGSVESGKEITRIEVHSEEFSDHSEVFISAYSGEKAVVRIDNMPVIITWRMEC